MPIFESMNCRRAWRLAVVVSTTLVLGTAATPAGAASAGSVDTAFGTNGTSTVPVGSLAVAVAATVQSNGAIVSAGEATVAGTNVILSTRMLSSGAPDPAYGHSGTVTVNINGGACANAVALQPDGKIVLAGTGGDLSSGTLAFAAVRLLPNGQLDPQFGHGGVSTVPIGTEAIANAVSIRPDGKIVLGGMATVAHPEFASARLNSNGSIDSSFGRRGVVTLAPPAAAWGMVLQPDGKVVLAGQQDYRGAQAFMAARLTTSGTLDATFGNGGLVTVPVGSTAIGNAVALQPDGRIVLAGNAFTSTSVAATVRLMSNGSLDPSFGSGGIATLPLWEAVNAVGLQSDGEILLGATGATAVRMNRDGTPDQTFGTGGATRVQLGTGNDAANGVTTQPDGGIILSGVAHMGGTAVLSVIRLLGAATSASVVSAARDTATSRPVISTSPAFQSQAQTPQVRAAIFLRRGHRLLAQLGWPFAVRGYARRDHKGHRTRHLHRAPH